MEISSVLEAVRKEVDRATFKYGPFVSNHEGFAILLEEVDELWEIIKKKPDSIKQEELRMEAIQVAAMAARFLVDRC